MRAAFINIKNCVNNCFLTQIAGCLRAEAANRKMFPRLFIVPIVTEIIELPPIILLLRKKKKLLLTKRESFLSYLFVNTLWQGSRLFAAHTLRNNVRGWHSIFRSLSQKAFAGATRNAYWITCWQITTPWSDRSRMRANHWKSSLASLFSKSSTW